MAAIGGGTFAYLKYRESIDATSKSQESLKEKLSGSVDVIKQDILLSEQAKAAKIAETKARIEATRAAIEETKAKAAQLPPALQIPPLRAVEEQKKLLAGLGKQLDSLNTIKKKNEEIDEDSSKKNQLTERQKRLLSELNELRVQEIQLQAELSKKDADRLALLSEIQKIQLDELNIQIEKAKTDDQRFNLNLQRNILLKKQELERLGTIGQNLQEEARVDQELARSLHKSKIALIENEHEAITTRINDEFELKRQKLRDEGNLTAGREASLAQEQANRLKLVTRARKRSLDDQLRDIEAFGEERRRAGLTEVDQARLRFQDELEALRQKEQEALRLAGNNADERLRIAAAAAKARAQLVQQSSQEIIKIREQENERLLQLAKDRFDQEKIFLSLSPEEVKRTFEDAVANAKSFNDFWKSFWGGLLTDLKRQFARQFADLLFGRFPGQNQSGQAGQGQPGPQGGNIFGAIFRGILGLPATIPNIGPGGTAPFGGFGPVLKAGSGPATPEGDRPDLLPAQQELMRANDALQLGNATRDQIRRITDQISTTLESFETSCKLALDRVQRQISARLDQTNKLLEAILAAIQKIGSQSGQNIVSQLFSSTGFLQSVLGGVAGVQAPILAGFPGSLPGLPGQGGSATSGGGLLGRIPGLEQLGKILFPNGFNAGGLLGGLLGGVLGNPSGVGQIFGGLGGSILGSLVLGGATSGGLAGIGAALLSNPFTAILGGALFALGPIFGAFARRGRDKKLASASVEEMFAKIEELVGEVLTDQRDGQDAIRNAHDLWEQWIGFLDKEVSSTVKNRSINSQFPFFQQKIDQLQFEAVRQQERRRIGQGLIPEFQRGGQVGSQLILTEPGELILSPEQVRQIGSGNLEKLNSMIVPGTSRGRDDVPIVVESGAFVLQRRAVENLFGPMNLSCPDRSNSAQLAQLKGMLRGFQEGGLVGLGGLPPELLMLLLFFLQGGLSGEEIQILIGLLQGGTAELPDGLKNQVLAALAPIIDRLPESQQQQIIQAIQNATSFGELQSSIQSLLSSPEFIQGLLDPLLQRIPEGPARDFFSGALGSILPTLLASGDIRELIRSPEFLSQLLMGGIGGLGLKPLPKAILELLLPALISRQPIRDILSNPQLVEPIIQQFLPNFLSRFDTFTGLGDEEQAALVGALGGPLSGLVTGIAGQSVSANDIQQIALFLTPLLSGRAQFLGLLGGFLAPEIANFLTRSSGDQVGADQSRPGILQRFLPLLPLLGLFGQPTNFKETGFQPLLKNGAQISVLSSLLGLFGSGQGLTGQPGGNPLFLTEPRFDDFGFGSGLGGGGGVFSGLTPPSFSFGGAAPVVSSPPPQPASGQRESGRGAGGARRETNNFFLVIGDQELEAVASKISPKTARQVRAILVRGF